MTIEKMRSGTMHSNSNIDEFVDFVYEKILNAIEKASSLEKVNSKNKKNKGMDDCRLAQIHM